MRMIDVLNKQCEGEIRKGTKLIVDFSLEQDSPKIYIYNGESFVDENYNEWYVTCGAHNETLNTEVELIPPESRKYRLKLYKDDDLSYVTRNYYDKDFNYDLGSKTEVYEFITEFTQDEINEDKFLKFVEMHGIKEEVEENENN